VKILRYLIFMSILSGIFFVIYRQSDEKGFHRWRTSFKAAVIIAASAVGLMPINTNAIEPPGNNNQVYQERLLLDQEFNSFEDKDQKVILVGRDSSGTSSNVPSNIKRQGQSPSNFPTPPAVGKQPSRPVYVPKYRTAPKIVPGPGLGARANPAGAGGGGGAAEFDDQCSVPENKESQESKFDYDYPSNAPKKKKRNQHLNRQIDVNGEKFEFEWDQIEKKAPSHGPEFGLEPDYGPDGKIIRDRKTGKPRAKQNKENYEKFAGNLEEFAKDPKSERIEPQYRKGRENEQDAVGFLNRKDKRFIIFDRHTKKYITGWVMNELQYQEFIENNNII
jgi:hypothetical protein